MSEIVTCCGMLYVLHNIAEATLKRNTAIQRYTEPELEPCKLAEGGGGGISGNVKIRKVYLVM